MRSAQALSRVTHVFGKEPVLVNEVIGHLRKEISPLPLNFHTFSDIEPWEELDQFSIEDRSSRLVLVRDAHLVGNWTPLESLYALIRKQPNMFVVFVSDVKIEPLASQMNQNSAISQTVICNGLSIETPKDKWGKSTRQPDSILWMQSRGDISPLNAKYLWNRVDGDLVKIKDVLAKASLFSGEITQAVINALVSESVGDVFVDSLLRLDKPKACLAIPNVGPERYSSIIGLLDSSLDMMARLNVHHKAFKDRRAAACDEAIPTFFTARYWEASRRWDPPRRQVARAALGALDGPARASWGSGSQDGVLEALTALW